MPPRRPERETHPHDPLSEPRFRFTGGRRSLTIRFDAGATQLFPDPRVGKEPTPAARPGKPAPDPSDPRQVLAARTRQLITGAAVVAPADRAELVRIGRILGLTPFQANLIIAIVQDQARRGQSPGAADDLLAMVGTHGPSTGTSTWRIAGWCSLVLLLEALAVILLVN